MVNNNSNNVESNNNIKNNNNKLKKNSIGILECISLSVGGIGLSAALFFVFPQIAKVVGTSSPFTLIIGTIFCLTLVSTISEYSNYLPNSASLFYFISHGFGISIGFFSICLTLIGYLILLIAVVIMFSTAFAEVIIKHTKFKECPWIIGIPIILLIIPILAYIGKNPILKLSIIFIFFETIVMLINTIIIVVKGGEEGNYPLAFTPIGEYSSNIEGIFRGLVYCCFIFIGFEGAISLGKETKNPKKSIPIAIYSSVIIASIWLIWAMYSMTIACGPSHIFQISDYKSPVELFTAKFVSYWYSILITIVGIISSFIASSCIFNNLFRMLYSIGKYHYHSPPTTNFDDTSSDSTTDGDNIEFPTISNGNINFLKIGKYHKFVSNLSKTSKKYSTPYIAITTLSIFLLISLGIIALVGGISVKDGWRVYGNLSFISTIPIILLFIFCNFSFIKFMKIKKKQQPFSFKYNYFKHFILPLTSGLLFTALLIGNFYPSIPKEPLSYLLIALSILITISIIITLFLTFKKKNYLKFLMYKMSLELTDI